MHYENSQISTCWQLARLVQGNHWGVKGPDYLLDRMMKMCRGGSSESSSSPIGAMSVHVFCIPSCWVSQQLSVTLPSPSRLWNDPTISYEVRSDDKYRNINSNQLDLVVLKLASWWLPIMMFYGQCKPLSPKIFRMCSCPGFLIVSCVLSRVSTMSGCPIHHAMLSCWLYQEFFSLARPGLMFHQASRRLGHTLGLSVSPYSVETRKKLKSIMGG